MTVMRAAIGAEWTKLWTTRTVWWALGAAAMLMAAGAGQYAIYAGNGDLAPALLSDGRVPVGTVAVLAVGVTQLAFVALAMLVVTSEYSTGTIRATLAWIPSRGRLLLAKCAVVGTVTLVAGTAVGLLGALVAAAVLGDLGDTGAVAIGADALGIGAYLMLLAVFATGLGAALRGPVVTLVVVLLLVVVLPPLLQVPDLTLLDRIADSLPGVAGNHFLLGEADPYPALVGLLVLAAWAVAAVLAGWRVMHHRDA
ncbi:ABC transporter permease [Micromonospora sp. NPDC023956]|uniref:ABC transporter permease n=1 Tax=Micromonospora sp. NPDC023956 TaxID=3155722 RepID=UPI0033DCED8B